MIVHLPRSREHFLYPAAVPGIKRLPRVSTLVAKSARSYALKTIRANGLDGDALWNLLRTRDPGLTTLLCMPCLVELCMYVCMYVYLYFRHKTHRTAHRHTHKTQKRQKRKK